MRHFGTAWGYPFIVLAESFKLQENCWKFLLTFQVVCLQNPHSANIGSGKFAISEGICGAHIQTH
jgi:hypothetical protein